MPHQEMRPSPVLFPDQQAQPRFDVFEERLKVRIPPVPNDDADQALRARQEDEVSGLLQVPKEDLDEEKELDPLRLHRHPFRRRKDARRRVAQGMQLRTQRRQQAVAQRRHAVGSRKRGRSARWWKRVGDED